MNRRTPPSRQDLVEMIYAMALALGIATMMLCIPGCGAPGYIRAEAIQGTLRRVIARERVYTTNDASLSDQEKRINLRDGELLEAALDTALSAGEKKDE